MAMARRMYLGQLRYHDCSGRLRSIGAQAGSGFLRRCPRLKTTMQKGNSPPRDWYDNPAVYDPQTANFYNVPTQTCHLSAHTRSDQLRHQRIAT